MPDLTLVTAAQLADAQVKATAITKLAKLVAPAASFKFLVLLDGTRNIATDPTFSGDTQPTSIGQLNALLTNLQIQNLLTNADFSYKSGVGTPGTQTGSALNPTQQAEKTANEIYAQYAKAAFIWRQDAANANGDITAMIATFSRGNYTGTILQQKLFTEGLIYLDADKVEHRLANPGEATITLNLAISPVNTFGQGATGLPPTVLNTVGIIAGAENRAGFIQADLSTLGSTNVVIPTGHGDAAYVYLNSIGAIFQPAYKIFLAMLAFSYRKSHQPL